MSGSRKRVVAKVKALVTARSRLMAALCVKLRERAVNSAEGGYFDNMRAAVEEFDWALGQVSAKDAGYYLEKAP